jgi:hypothetical protein
MGGDRLWGWGCRCEAKTASRRGRHTARAENTPAAVQNSTARPLDPPPSAAQQRARPGASPVGAIGAWTHSPPDLSLMTVMRTGVKTSKASSDCVCSKVQTWPRTTWGGRGVEGCVAWQRPFWGVLHGASV